MLQRDRDYYSHDGIRGESMDINILHMVPKFLLRDPNGYALAKAIEAAMAYYSERVEAGIDAVTNPDKMPEWRLDEMAWDKGCMYGYDASLEAKRDWIKNAGAYSRLLGTPEGLLQYIRGYFPRAQVEEWFQYDGDPYHFRLVLPDKLTQKRFEFILRAVEYAKNVRSTLDTMNLTLQDETANMYHGTGLVISTFLELITPDDEEE